MVSSSSRPLRVIISSTFDDLQEFRQEAIHAVRGLELDVVAMEDSAAKSKSKEEASYAMVQQADIMVLILSYRYGETTAKEYQWAVELNLAILAFIPAMSEPHNTLDVEPDPARRQLLDELITKVQSQQVTDVYSSPKDLRHRVLQALTIELKQRQLLLREVAGPIYDLPEKLPSEYVPRPEAMERLKAAICNEDARRAVGIVAAAATVGQGGIGKTVLARALCNEPELRQQLFRDGILWATIGQRPSEGTLLAIQQRWIVKLNPAAQPGGDLDQGKATLEQLLESRQMLLVFDDVWEAQDLTFLRVSGEHLYTLITTRNADEVADTIRVELEVMTLSESVELLTRTRHGTVPNQNAIAKRLGYLPLTLSMIGSLLSIGHSWQDVQYQLDHGRLPQIHHEHQKSPFAVIAASVRFLPAEVQQRFLMLSIFPADVPLAITSLLRLWYPLASTPDDLPHARYAIIETLDILRKRSLLQADNGFHDLVYDYLQAATTAEERQQWHQHLIATYGQPSAWGTLPDEAELYGWRRLAWHLRQARQNEPLSDLLTNVSYLQGKINRLKVASVLTDLTLAPNDTTLHALRQTVQLSAHVLGRAPEELMNQVVGRGGPGTRLHDEPKRTEPHFTLLSPTLQLAGGAQVRIMTGHTESVNACAMTPDGCFALSGSDDGTLRLWDLQTGDIVHTLQGHAGSVIGCAMTADGHFALSGSVDRTLRLWNLQTGESVLTLEGHTGPVQTCAMTPDGRFALSGSVDRTLRLWDLQTGEVVRTLDGHTGSVFACEMTADGHFALSGSDDRTLRLWDMLTGEVVRTLDGLAYSVLCCVMTPDGHFALSSSADQMLRLWNLHTGEVVRMLESHASSVNACAMTPDGCWALSGSDDGALQLWNLQTGEVVCTLEEHTDRVNACAMTPDRRFAISASWDRTLRLWDLQSGAVLRTMAGHSGPVECCAITSDGHFALSGSGYPDNTLRLWDLESGAILRILEGHTGWVSACAITPDGRIALSASWDQTLRLWDLQTGQVLCQWAAEVALLCCAFSLQTNLAIAGDVSGALHRLRIENVAFDE